MGIFDYLKKKKQITRVEEKSEEETVLEKEI